MQAEQLYLWAIGLMGLMTGCVQNQKIDNDTLVIGIESEVKNFDVRTSSDANSWHVANVFGQGLVTFNEELLPDPDLAESFQVKDAQVYTFQLPAQATFHDGTPLSCADVEYSFQQAASGPNMAKSFEDLSRFECLNPHTFVIALKAPRASFLLSDVERVRVFPKHLGQSEAFKQHPIASGPYRFLRREDRDLIFERFENYKSFRRGKVLAKPKYKRLIVRMVQDQTTRFLSLMGGDMDMLINALPFRKVIEAQDNPFLSVHTTPGSSYSYLGMNLLNKKFQDRRVRLALAKAIDRRKIIEHKFFGLAQIGTTALPPSSPYFHAGIAPIEYDPAGARRLLKEAGVGQLEIEVKISNDREIGSIMLILKKYWEEVGIQVTVKPFEFGTFFADIKRGNFEMYMLRWTALIEPDTLHYIFNSEEVPPGRNRVHYKNLQVDKLLKQARIEGNFEIRKQLYWKSLELIAFDLPYIPLWYPFNVAVGSRTLKNFKLQSSGEWTSLLFSTKEDLP